jgi:dihydropteroate synthase
VPHEQLHTRPFALWPLADVAPHWVYPLPGLFYGKTAVEIAEQWGSRFTGDAPLHCRQIPHRIDTPQLVGIVNVTPDSFSDGGQFLESEAAIQQCVALINSGAEIIDLGAESTRPNAANIDSETEWLRLEKILTQLLAKKSQHVIPPKISIDTRHADVAKKALALGVDWINDVSGLDDVIMRELIAEQACDVVFMHHLGIPVDKSIFLPLNEAADALVYHWAKQRLHELEQSGIARARLIFDVGVGYGKTAEQSLSLIKNIRIFHELGVRLLVGHSRKSFLSQFTHKPAVERDAETVALSLHLAKENVNYLRVHNVEVHARAFKVGKTVLI